jgi:predicted nucleic acid-binding protein
LGLVEDLGPGPVALDAAIFIYFIEEHREYLPVVKPVFTAIAGGELKAVTSSLTLLEVLVLPLRAGLAALAARYEALLTRGANLKLVEIDLPLLRVAAHLRAVTRIKTPDSLQLAAATAAGCTAFLTHDRELPSLPGLRVVKLRNYL